MDAAERDYRNCGVMPQAAQGIVFLACAWCGAPMGTAPVAQSDDANGRTSHDQCSRCHDAMMEDVRDQT